MPNANGAPDTLLVEEVDQIISKQMPIIQLLGPAAIPKRSLGYGQDVMIVSQTQQQSPVSARRIGVSMGKV